MLSNQKELSCNIKIPSGYNNTQRYQVSKSVDIYTVTHFYGIDRRVVTNNSVEGQKTIIFVTKTLERLITKDQLYMFLRHLI